MNNQKIIFTITILSCLFIGTLLSSKPITPKEYLPEAKGEIVKHRHFTLDYNEEHEQANWVYYEVNRNYIKGTATRKNKFHKDIKVSTGSALLSDYKGSGYDRGHLCPSAIMKLNQVCNDETFVLSNISPQLPCFNRYQWKDLESKIRYYASREEKLIIITGPVFPDEITNENQIGENKVTIPLAYFKVIYSPGRESMVAYLMEHKCEAALLTTSVDHIENITKIDFFRDLPDEIENVLEKNITW